eukprot:2088290-Pyramimonas_sp.AAC.1
MRTVGGWGPEHQFVPVRAPSCPLPHVTVVEPLLLRLDTGFIACRSCCRSTALENGPTLGQFYRFECTPNAIDRLRAGTQIRKYGAQSIPTHRAVQLALLAADRFDVEEGVPVPALESAVSIWDEHELVEHDGHRLRRAGATAFCEKCVCAMVGSGSLSGPSPTMR